VYPYFPSGTIIGSDIEKGLFVWTLADPLVPSSSAPITLAMALLIAAGGAFALRGRVRRPGER